MRSLQSLHPSLVLEVIYYRHKLLFAKQFNSRDTTLYSRKFCSWTRGRRPAALPNLFAVLHMIWDLANVRRAKTVRLHRNIAINIYTLYKRKGKQSQGDRTDDESSKYLWNVGKFLPEYQAQHPRRQSSSGVITFAGQKQCHSIQQH
jgi:hypothetical protein